MLPPEIVVSRSRSPIPALDPALKERARLRIAECVELFRRHGVPLRMPSVSFDLRGVTAGVAMPARNHIRLNAVLLAENVAEFLEQTVGHEVAHLAVAAAYGLSAPAHGRQWKQMMALLGLPAERCHSYDVSNAVAGRRYRYACACDTPHLLTLGRHRVAQNRGYICRRCGERLRPEGTPAPVRAIPSPAPAVPPVPARPRSGTPPTPSMVKFAKDLARELKLVLTREMLSDYSATSAFIDQARALRVALRRRAA